MGGRKSVAILMGYTIISVERIQNGVQGVRGSNPRVPTRKFNKKSRLGISQSALFCSFGVFLGFV